MAVNEMHSNLYGVLPEIPALDFSGLHVPLNDLAPILEKNRAAIRDEVSFKDYTDKDSPYRTHKFFDDQLLEVLFSIESRYTPSEFIAQLVWLIHQFLSEPAAFRASIVQDRIDVNEGEKSVSTILFALDQARDPDEKETLRMLLMELTEGGQEPWMEEVSEELRTRVLTLTQSG